MISQPWTKQTLCLVSASVLATPYSPVLCSVYSGVTLRWALNYGWEPGLCVRSARGRPNYDNNKSGHFILFYGWVSVLSCGIPWV